jgi:putative hydrolase of the HAD superfamily
MKRSTKRTRLFLDIGGVLLTGGCGYRGRKRAATNFRLELGEIQEGHGLTFEAYEQGSLTLEEYLTLVVFCEKRPFTRAQFRRFMFA